jgi:hypothetical protein
MLWEREISETREANIASYLREVKLLQTARSYYFLQAIVCTVESKHYCYGSVNLVPTQSSYCGLSRSRV